MADTLLIYKPDINKFWHTHNGDESTKFAISDFEVSIDGVNFNIIQNDGAARFTYLVNNITIKVGVGGPIETFSTAESLYNRLIEIAYTPFAGISEGPGLTYTPEDVANKATTIYGHEFNTNEYPNIPAVVEYVTDLISAISDFESIDYPILTVSTQNFIIPSDRTAKFALVNNASWVQLTANNSSKANTFTQSGDTVIFKTSLAINSYVVIFYQ